MNTNIVLEETKNLHQPAQISSAQRDFPVSNENETIRILLDFDSPQQIYKWGGGWS